MVLVYVNSLDCINKNLPSDAKGKWTGTKGNSIFDPLPGTDLYRATGGRSIRYKDGVADLTPFAKSRLYEVPNLTGKERGRGNDFTLAKEYSRNNDPRFMNFTSNLQVQRYLSGKKLSLHHHYDVNTGKVGVIIVDRNMHSRLSHGGGAYLLRTNRAASF